jgi:hypothetical protein
MVRFVAHFDGKQLLPDEPVDLPTDRPLQVTVDEVPIPSQLPPLNLAQFFESIVSETGLVDGPVDWSAHHDQYLFGAPSGDGPDGD